ncbi:Disulfide bond formation protein B [Beijerinckiaceae bacterium RH AL1]|nr:disulfide bond formation protein B [Beijerinckiaceae bacterium]VVB47721.1 Disulfide bond formation protein B [Beijerinckiaceae bacterium RH CH11]VVB47802.1 Disulfide bond formation protein B [Beijerinckiaceae bacterium RH AL8]VVC56031.1 Disulfide bond formation protein B [Beijerinckiaceae bacterium RH AL1]
MDAPVAVVERPLVRPAALVLALAVATIAGAFAFQAAGYAPCELCLKERLPYYAGIALAVLTLALAWRGPPALARVGLGLLVVLFLFSAGFGVYHAGVEWKWWPGPTGCTGAINRPTSNADFLQQLHSVHVVRCDAVAIRILGLSLAGWNAIVSLVIAGLAAAGLRR